MSRTRKTQGIRHLFGRFIRKIKIPLCFENDPPPDQLRRRGIVAKPKNIRQRFWRLIHSLCIELDLMLCTKMYFQQQVEFPDHIHPFAAAWTIMARLLLGNPRNVNDQPLEQGS